MAERMPVCRATRGERTVLTLSAVFVAAFAVSTLAQPWIAVPAAVAAAVLAAGAITGRCLSLPAGRAGRPPGRIPAADDPQR